MGMPARKKRPGGSRCPAPVRRCNRHLRQQRKIKQHLLWRSGLRLARWRESAAGISEAPEPEPTADADLPVQSSTSDTGATHSAKSSKQESASQGTSTPPDASAAAMESLAANISLVSNQTLPVPAAPAQTVTASLSESQSSLTGRVLGTAPATEDGAAEADRLPSGCPERGEWGSSNGKYDLGGGE